MKRLKNSARNSRLLCSVICVVFDTAMSRLIEPGPRMKFRGKVPYVANAGLATICSSEGNTAGPGTGRVERIWASGVRETGWIKPIVTGRSWIQRRRRTDDIRVSITWVSGTRGSLGIAIILVIQSRKNVEGQAGMPRENGEHAPTLRQPLWRRFQHVVDGKVPSAAYRDAIPDVLVARRSEQVGIVSRHI